jgi:predicted nucleotidyltransferase
MVGQEFTFGRWHPAPIDLAALEACLIENSPRSSQAFERWSRFAGASLGNNRLHGLLLNASRRYEWSHPLLVEVRTSALQVAAFSMLVRRHGTSVLAELQAQGFRPVVLKGLALQELAYPGLAERPITDVDFLVSENEAVALDKFLHDRGWSTSSKRDFGPGTFASYASVNYTRDHYEQLDIHSRISHWARNPKLSKDMLQRAVPVTIDGVKLLTLDTTDHLLHTIAHGVTWEHGASIRWVPDSVHLIRTGSVDWNRFLQDITQSGFGPAALEAIRFLRARIGIEIPESVEEALARHRFSVRDRAVHWIRTGPPTKLRLAIRLVVIDYSARTAEQTALAIVLHYPGFLWRTVRRSKTHSTRAS